MIIAFYVTVILAGLYSQEKNIAEEEERARLARQEFVLTDEELSAEVLVNAPAVDAEILLVKGSSDGI
jgi:hypothetical protein